MKVLRDTSVYVAEALLGEAAEQMFAATERASWRIYASAYILEEVERVLVEKLGFSRRLSIRTRRRIIRRSALVTPGSSRHVVPQDPQTVQFSGRLSRQAPITW